MSNPLEYDKVVKLFHAQTRSADMWIEQYNRYKDVSGVRNASLAIGKLMGLFNVLLTMKGSENVEEDILSLVTKYHAVWDNLVVEKA